MKRTIDVFISLFALFAILASTPAMAVKGRQSVPFTYAIMGDPQYPWWPYENMDMPSACAQYTRRDASLDPNVEGDCKKSNDMTADWDTTDLVCEWTWEGGEGNAQECAAQVENEDRVNGIKDLANLTWLGGKKVEKPAAIVINGDLTSYFHPYELKAYEKYYNDELSDYNVLPGLGNHDYQNNFEADPNAKDPKTCFAGTLNSYKCYENAVEYMREVVTGARASNFPTYWVDAYDPHSLSYSWSQAHYLFIQMHNYPDYHTDHDEFSIDPSWSWVMDQINEADEDGKYVVLNLHDYDSITAAELNDLKGTPVVIIFAGHQLSRLGKRNTVSGPNKFGNDIPVWHSGHSGSKGYDHKMLLAEFGAQSITVATVDVQGGKATLYSSSSTLYYDTYNIGAAADHQLIPPVKGFVAVGVPKEGVVKTTEGEQEDAGAVSVTYWNDLGNISSNQWFQDISGIEDHDEHGASLATGDFNGDGYPDLAAGAPLENTNFNDVNNAGRLSVVYGTDNGLTGDTTFFTQNELPGSEEDGDKTAQTLASGDFNGDGFDDLAVGVPEEDLGDCGNNAGSIILMFGSASGLTASGSYSMNQTDAGGSCEANDNFGSTLAVGDFNNDGYDDLAVGSNGEEIGGDNNVGAVRVLYGGASGITGSGNDNLNQESIAGTDFMDKENEPNDEFGFALAAGDFNGDGYDDLAIGVPFEDVNCDSNGTGTDNNNDESNDSGKVVIAYGSAGGITGVGAQDLDSRDFISNSCEGDDRIGYALAAGDFNADRYDDLAIGAPGEDLGSTNDAGNVIYMFGGPGGLSGSNLTNLNQDEGSGSVEANDHLGWTLAAGDADLDGYDDLAIGVPDEDWDGANDNGVVYVLFGQPGGLSWSNSTHLGGDAYNRTISDGSENNDQFGLALAITRAIQDETPPVLSLPGTIIEEATSLTGNIVTFNATAIDDWDGSVPVLCTPPSGYLFPIFITTVLCSATDDAGNTAAGAFSVVIQDTTPPSLTLPSDITEEATGAGGAVVTFDATATDIVDPIPTVSCIPPSGALFALGTTQVDCTAFDLFRNSTSGSFNVNVVDTTPPDVTVPADITVTATKPAGADVSWNIADAVDIVDGAITPTCTPASGSTFGHGTTPVSCEATDAAGNTGSNGFSVTVENARPTADSQSVSTDEDVPLNITLTGDDVDEYPEPALSFSVVTGPSNGELTGTEPNLVYTPDLNWNGSDSFTFKTYDGELYSEIATVSITVDPVNDAPVISIDRTTATLQYSDTIGTVNITAYDVDDDPLTLSSTWTKDSGAANAGLPSNLATAGGCTPKSYGDAPETGTVCAWTLSGQMLEPSGDYDITFKVTDGGGNTATFLDDSGPTELIVKPENATIAFDANNTVAVQVTADGSDASEPFSLVFTVWESMPDNATFKALAGDISNAFPEIGVTLSPVGPGSVASSTGCVYADNGMTGYAEQLTVTCSFDAVPVNTYSVDVSINGGYYTGANEDVITVYDPSLGFTSGGGWFYWPGTTDKTNFGYTMKYNKKATNIQGSLMLIRHIEGAPEGEDKWRIKSNSINGLALGSETDFSWAAFDGKTNYLAPGLETVGNYEFTVYVEDYGQSGAGSDRVWIEVRDKDDDVVADLSMDETAPANAVTLEGGGITVPH